MDAAKVSKKLESNKVTDAKKPSEKIEKKEKKEKKVKKDDTTKNFIGKQGYVINKKNITSEQLTDIKEDLLITPTVMEEFSKDIKPYPIYHEDEDTITIPRYYGVSKFGDTTKKFTPLKTSFTFTKELRPYQIDIINNVIPQMNAKGGGLISLPCGRGKTIIALALAQKLGLKTLVLVHKSFLQDQWIDRAKTFTNAKIGIIRQSTIDIENKDIVIGMIQSISMKEYDPKIFTGFGLVIVDECHHIASRVFSRALYKTGSTFTLGLSATPKRQDGLTKIIYWYLGKMMYQEEREMDNKVIVRKLNMVLDDPLFKEKTQWSPKGFIPSMPRMITNFSKIERRNQVIINIINILRKNPKRKILILSGRIAHLEFLKAEIDKKIAADVEAGKLLKDDIRTNFYIGKMKPEERKGAELYADILFASYEMAHEGLDIDKLNTVILATPKRSVIQAIGRIMRKILTAADIKPLIIDITDKLSAFTNQGEARYKLYKKNGYCIREFMVNNNFQVPIDSYAVSNNKIVEKDNIKLSTIFNEEELDKIILDKQHNPDAVKRFKRTDFETCMFD